MTHATEFYGIPFPADYTRMRAELACYRYPNLREHTGLTPDEHLLRAIRCKFTAKDYVIHSWCEWRAWSWCNHEEISWIGSGSCGKSCDAAMFSYMDLLAGPFETSTTIFSTTKGMLRRRIWRDVIRFYEIQPFRLNYRRADFMITPEDKPDTINFIAGKGILRDDGTVQVSDLFGVHNKRNRVIIDEGQGTPWFLIEGMVNAQLGGLHGDGWKCLVMGNPEDEEDTLCRFAAPNGGWLQLDVADKQWTTAGGGIALHFDGLDSPAIVEADGAKKYPFLIRQKDVDKIKRRFNETSIRYMSQVRGWLVRGASTDRVIDYPTLDLFHVWEKGTRFSGFTRLTAVDPAFSSGGDRCQAVSADLYRDDFDTQILEFVAEESIPIGATEEIPLAYMLVNHISEFCLRQGVDSADRLALDITGQQKILPDLISREWSPGAHRVDFNGPASERMFDVELELRMRDVYYNRVTELWMVWTQLVKEDQIRGLSRDTAKEFTARRLKWKAKRQQVETKEDMRKRVGYSPDRADAQVILVDLALIRYGLVIGRQRQLPSRRATIAKDPFADTRVEESWDSELIG